MRDNSALWMAAIAVGGLLVAGLAGTVALFAFKSSGVQKARQERDLAEAENQLAGATTPTMTQPTGRPPTQPTPPPPSNPSAGELWKQAQVSETARQIFDGYQGNAVAADQKYKGKLIATTGTVEKVDLDPQGRGVVVFSVGESIGDFNITVGVVHCTVDNVDKDQLATLSQGHAVALVGYGGGKVLNAVKLEKCRILFTAANEQSLMQKFRDSNR